MPVKPPVDDALFSMCFHCSSSETEGGPALTQLHSSSDIKVCDFCRGSMFKQHGETLTRDKVRSVGSWHPIGSESLPKEHNALAPLALPRHPHTSSPIRPAPPLPPPNPDVCSQPLSLPPQPPPSLQVQSYFHFTKAEAAAIPCTTSTGGFYKSKIYVYKLGSVVSAVNKKYGSLYLMAKNNGGD